MNFANVTTGEIRETLPNVLQTEGRTITGATLAEWAASGWRAVAQVDTPAAGYRVTQYGVQELDGVTCRLTVDASVNLAAEAAAQLSAAKDMGKAIMDTGSYDLALAVRAFALLTLQEINTLRTKAGLANYSQAQFLAALKAKMDSL